MIHKDEPLKAFMRRIYHPGCENGELVFTGKLSWRSKFVHRCQKCGERVDLDKIYPSIFHVTEKHGD